jgi:ribosome-associated protein
VRAIAEFVDARLSEKGISPLHLEGMENLQWVIMDYNDVVVHLFDRESRIYYALERLWGDAPRVDYQTETQGRPRRKQAS